MPEVDEDQGGEREEEDGREAGQDLHHRLGVTGQLRAHADLHPDWHPDERRDREQDDHSGEGGEAEPDEAGEAGEAQVGIEVDEPDHGHRRRQRRGSPTRRRRRRPGAYGELYAAGTRPARTAA